MPLPLKTAFTLIAPLIALVNSIAVDIARTIPDNPEIPAYRLERGYKPQITAIRVEIPPKIDGVLDDEAWSNAEVGGPIIQNSPRAGKAMDQQTEFRVAYDSNNIYVAVWCWDSEPDKIVARYMRRDDSMRPDDYVIIALDTFNDQRNGYWFRFNPNGTRQDGIISNNININVQWDGIWNVKTQVTEKGWFAEVAFPLNTFSFDPDSTDWGLNVTRNIKRVSQRGIWSSPRSSMRSYYMAEAGTLKGLSGLKQGLGLELNPYLLGKESDDRESGESEFNFEWGGDFRYRISPKLSATVSYNTDFAAAETDARQINLTRFSAFFPEKRRFFLEEAGVFNFGGLEGRVRRGARTSPVFLPYFSRRIGLNSSGQVAPLVGAAKLTGRVGDFDVGIINALLESGEELGSQNTFVGRVSKPVLDQSTVGAIVTHGDPNSDYDNLVVGSDFRYLSNNFLDKYRLEANAFILASQSDNPKFDDGLAPSFGGNFVLPADEFELEGSFLQIDEDFNPAMGFAPRRGIRRLGSTLTYQPRPEDIAWLRQYYLIYEGEYVTNLSNQLESSRHVFTPLSFVFESSDSIYFRFENSFDAPLNDFEISDGIVIPSGDYEWNRGIIGVSTATKRMVNMTHEFTFGSFYNGDRTENRTKLNYLPSKHFGTALSYTIQNVELPGGEFNVKLASLTALVNITPDFTWSNVAQYDNKSDTLGINSRLIWEYKPGKRIFLVLNQSYLDERTGFVLRQMDTTLKLSSIYRF
jgi:hypothetical protein